MVLRSQWLRGVENSRQIVFNRADRLIEESPKPEQIEDLAQRLGASIIRLRDDAPAKGYLSSIPGESGWIIRVKGSLEDGLDQNQQFTVAHEIAHIFFIESGRLPPGPCSEAEYWVLEKVCDAVAARLLSIET